MVARYPHLKLMDWPFRVEPDPVLYGFMADRVQLRAEVDGLLQRLSRRTPSSIHLMWAYFGAGKTHTLRYIEQLARDRYKTLVPVYAVFPKATKGFLDLYQLTVTHLDFEMLRTAYEEIYTDVNGSLFLRRMRFDFPDLALVFRKLLGAPESEEDLCIRWLKASELDRRSLRSIGIAKPISSSEDAVNVLAWLIQILSAAAEMNQRAPVKLLWLLDEYQRIKDCRTPVQQDINTAVHSVFNRSPNHLSILISFSGHPEEKKWPAWLSPEIRDRIGVVSNVLLLPPLGKGEAEKFVLDLLTFFRIPGTSGDDFFPFSKAAAGEVIRIMQEKKVELKPRAIMQFFTAVLESADTRIESGELSVISWEFVRSLLKTVNYKEAELGDDKSH